MIKSSLKNCLITKYESEGKRAKNEEESKNSLLDKITEKKIVPLPWNILYIKYQYRKKLHSICDEKKLF